MDFRRAPQPTKLAKNDSFWAGSNSRVADLSRVSDHSVATVTLGAIERLVGPLEDQFGSVIGEFEGRHAYARGHIQGANPFSGIERRRRDALAQALPDKIGFGEIGVGHHDHELLATQAAREVDAADIAPDSRGKLSQYGVAGVVAVAVVHGLEVVDVEQEQRQRLAALRGFLEQRLQVAGHVTAVM